MNISRIFVALLAMAPALLMAGAIPIIAPSSPPSNGQVLVFQNGAAASLSGLSMVYPTSTTTTMVLNSDTTALTAATQYIWYFTFSQ